MWPGYRCKQHCSSVCHSFSNDCGHTQKTGITSVWFTSYQPHGPEWINELVLHVYWRWRFICGGVCQHWADAEDYTANMYVLQTGNSSLWRLCRLTGWAQATMQRERCKKHRPLVTVTSYNMYMSVCTSVHRLCGPSYTQCSFQQNGLKIKLRSSSCTCTGVQLSSNTHTQSRKA